MFSAKTGTIGHYKEIRLTNDLTGEAVTLLPDKGATLNHLWLKQEGGDLVQVLWGSDSEEEVGKAGTGHFRGSLLLPFPNRVDGGSYQFEGVDYQLVTNFAHENNAIHGLVADKLFEVEALESSPDMARCVLKLEHKGEFVGYPFVFLLRVEYVLDANGLRVTTYTTNQDKGNMPYGVGWHPYFNLGADVDEIELTLPSGKQVEVDERLIPTGQFKDYTRFHVSEKLKDTSFDTGFALEKSIEEAEIILFNKKKGIKVTIWQQSAGSSAYQFLQVYTPRDRKTIAVEPMSCAADAFNNDFGTMVLAPGQTAVHVWGIK